MTTSRYTHLDEARLRRNRHNALRIRATIERTQVVLDETSAQIAETRERDQELLDMLASHSDRTNQSGRDE